jgi:uncharacterized membrane protein (DUF2068 family)
VTTQTGEGAAAVAGATPETRPPGALSRREARWLLRRCGRRGHVLAYLDDPIAARMEAEAQGGELARCLRCGSFVDSSRPDTYTQAVLGTPTARTPIGEVPLVLRGSHGRKLAVLRLLAIERIGRGLLLLLAAAAIWRLASSHTQVAAWLGGLIRAAQPLGRQLGWDVGRSQLLAEAQRLLGHSGRTFTTAALLVAGYAVLQLVEGAGLWAARRWAEYLAAVATSLFVPLEVYELVHHPTVLKAVALVINVAAVLYLVWKGRLFGFRGGHAAHLAEVRDATLLADELRAAGRPTHVLTGGAGTVQLL